MAEYSKFKNPLNFFNHLYEIDSKHVVMQVPACSCSSYFNYKKTLSIVFLVISTAKYEFKLIYAGEANRKKDSSICDKSALGNTVSKNLILLSPTQHQPLNIKMKLTKDWHLQWKWWDPIHRTIDLKYKHRFDLNSFLVYKWWVKADFHSRVFHVQIKVPIFKVDISDENKETRFWMFQQPMITHVENVKSITRSFITLHKFSLAKTSAATVQIVHQKLNSLMIVLV